MQNRPTFGQLKHLRNADAYSNGEIIDTAADLAMDVGPARRHRPRHLKPIARPAVSATTEIDYAGIDDQFAKQLAADGAPGWTAADFADQLSEPQPKNE